MGWSAGTYTRTNGTYTGAVVWTSDSGAGIDILANRHDTHDQDLASGINACLHKGGQNSPTANINWGGFKITGLANGSAATDAATYGQTITALAFDGSTRVLTATRSVANITVTLPVFSTTSAGLVPATTTATGRVLLDTGAFATIATGGGLLPTVRVTTSGPVVSGIRYTIGADAITLTLPAAPADGDTIFFVTETITYTSVVIAGNGKAIMETSEDMTLDTEGASFGLAYISATGDWRIV